MQKMQDETIVQRKPTRSSVARIELDNGISFTIHKGSLPFTIGRATDCDICLPSGLVSRHHCQLYLVNGVLCLKDTSSNGTIVDGRVVKRGSVSIQRETRVMFAGAVGIRVIPGTEPERSVSSEDRRHGERRMGDRRRQEDRRQNALVVNFERRKNTTDRRSGERRG